MFAGSSNRQKFQPRDISLCSYSSQSWDWTTASCMKVILCHNLYLFCYGGIIMNVMIVALFFSYLFCYRIIILNVVIVALILICFATEKWFWKWWFLTFRIVPLLILLYLLHLNQTSFWHIISHQVISGDIIYFLMKPIQEGKVKDKRARGWHWHRLIENIPTLNWIQLGHVHYENKRQGKLQPTFSGEGAQDDDGYHFITWTVATFFFLI